MGRTKDLLVDAWSAISYKAPLADEIEARQRGFMAPSWVPEDHRRRLAAYTILAAYEANMARSLLGGTDDDRDDNREYGDAALIIDMVTAHLLGESQEIVVLGAEEAADLLSEAASAGDSEGEGEDGEGTELEEPTDDLEAALALVERQEWLRDWARLVHLPLRVQDGERNAVTYGDGVYLLGWDTERERPTVAVMDPGFYFPVLPDTLDAYAYPETVHFAWELPGEDFADGKTRVRRITYRLGLLEDGVRFDEDTDEWVLPADTSRDARGRLVRQYPWNEDGAPSTRTCYVTDATWKLDDVKGGTGWDALSADAAVYHLEEVDSEFIEMRNHDLGIDFIPVVHVPNTTAGGQHYGQSSLSRVLQIIDDLQAADTDAQRASATAGSPIIGVSGSKLKGGDGGDRNLNVNAGEVWDLGNEGKLTTISTAAALAELRSYVEALRDRLSTNSRLPAAILGTLDPSDVPSGYAMQLSFGPLSAMIRSMRLTRSVKHPLLFKMVQRLAQANDALPPGPTPVAELRLGAFLPTDQAGTLKLVREAVEAGILSLPTAVKMLVDVGFPIEDIAEEVAAINSRDFEAANQLADAVGDLQAVFDFLGIDRLAEEAVAPVILPGGIQAPPVPPTPPTTTS